MAEKKLSEKLKFWRAERPDEWTMDEFIRDSIKLEQTNKELTESHVSNVIPHSELNCDGCQYGNGHQMCRNCKRNIFIDDNYTMKSE